MEDRESLLSHGLPNRGATIYLSPLVPEDAPDLLALAADPAVDAFTPIPSHADAGYINGMLERCDDAWRDGSGAFFSIRDATTEQFLGYGAAIRLQLSARQAELGYMVGPQARGRGVATEALRLLTDWCFDVLDLFRVELRINPQNEPSVKVAIANGYRLEGVLRSVHLKGDQRVNVGVWSRLRCEGSEALSSGSAERDDN